GWAGRDAVAPFDFPAIFLDYSGMEPAKITPPLPPSRGGLKTDSTFEVLRPIRAGDVLTIRHRLADLVEREGRTARLVFSTTETTGHDAGGALVFRASTTMVRQYPREA